MLHAKGFYNNNNSKIYIEYRRCGFNVLKEYSRDCHNDTFKHGRPRRPLEEIQHYDRAGVSK